MVELLWEYGWVSGWRKKRRRTYVPGPKGVGADHAGLPAFPLVVIRKLGDGGGLP